MMKSYHTLSLTTVLVLLYFCAAQTWSAYLPVLEEHNLNQLEGVPNQQHQRLSYTTHNAEKYRRDSSNGDSSEGNIEGASETTTEGNYNEGHALAVAASYTNTDEQTAALVNWRLLPHRSYDKNYDVVAAGKVPAHVVAWSSDQSSIFHAYKNNETSDEFEGDGDSDINIDMDEYGDSVGDENDKQKTNAEILSRKRRGFDDWFIAPHTRWCGRGNTANNTYNELGGASDADRCCRRHDYCPEFISAFSSRYELFNYRPYTLSHCNCDRRFRTCLKMNNDDASNTIGQLFFNMVPSQCFVVHHERQCRQRDMEGNCIKETTRKRAYARDNQKY